MSGGCWNYMNDSAASEILGYHIYVGYGLDSDRHEKNYKQVIRDNPLGDPEISALVYDVFCLLHSYDWAESGDTDMLRCCSICSSRPQCSFSEMTPRRSSGTDSSFSRYILRWMRA